MKPALKLSLAGFAATFVAYGPARMGFGLFLPEFRSTFSISSETAGLIAGLGFLGFLVGLLVAQALTARFGARLPILVGLCAATSGMVVVASARSPAMLSLGILLAMSSPGFSWSPFNDAVNHHVRDTLRSQALSIISTGTSLGILAAGVTALLLSLGDGSWRIAWAVFAGLSALAALANWILLRHLDVVPSPVPRKWVALLQPSAVPLYGIALSFGLTTAIFISFAADLVERAGGLELLPAGASSAVVFGSYGVFGILGLWTGRAEAVVGLAGLLRLLFLASAMSLFLIAAAPTSWPAVLISAGLQGLFVMMMSAVMSFWSERLFPGLASFGFTAVLLAVAVGSVLGPVTAGYAQGAVGVEATFIGTAVISLATMAIALPRFSRNSSD